MNQSKTWSNRIVVADVLLPGFGASHLIDDFLHHVSADFGLSYQLSQVLAAAFMTTSLLYRFRGMRNTPQLAPLSSSEAIVESGACCAGSWGLRLLIPRGLPRGRSLVLAAQGRKAGYAGHLALGLFPLPADMLMHGSEGLFAGPRRNGVSYRSLAFGLMIGAIAPR